MTMTMALFLVFSLTVVLCLCDMAVDRIVDETSRLQRKIAARRRLNERAKAYRAKKKMERAINV